jgi:hypothetical protein
MPFFNFLIFKQKRPVQNTRRGEFDEILVKLIACLPPGAALGGTALHLRRDHNGIVFRRFLCQ